MMEKDNEELCVQQWRLITQKPNILLGERAIQSLNITTSQEQKQTLINLSPGHLLMQSPNILLWFISSNDKQN